MKNRSNSDNDTIETNAQELFTTCKQIGETINNALLTNHDILRNNLTVSTHISDISNLMNSSVKNEEKIEELIKKTRQAIYTKTGNNQSRKFFNNHFVVFKSSRTRNTSNITNIKRRYRFFTKNTRHH